MRVHNGVRTAVPRRYGKHRILIHTASAMANREPAAFDHRARMGQALLASRRYKHATHGANGCALCMGT